MKVVIGNHLVDFNDNKVKSFDSEEKLIEWGKKGLKHLSNEKEFEDSLRKLFREVNGIKEQTKKTK